MMTKEDLLSTLNTVSISDTSNERGYECNEVSDALDLYAKDRSILFGIYLHQNFTRTIGGWRKGGFGMLYSTETAYQAFLISLSTNNKEEV